MLQWTAVLYNRWLQSSKQLYIINNRPLITQRDPITQRLVVIQPSHFIHPGDPDQFDHEMTNMFSAQTEEGLLERGFVQIQKFKNRLKLLFD
jgi:hypothetical protein